MKLLPLASIALVASTLCAFTADEDGFRPLLNGKDTTGWHLRHPDGRNSWSVENGVLKNTSNKDLHGNDLVSDAKFWNFMVKFEFMVPDKSNSGFYLRGRQEIQILGDYARGQATINGNGSIYNFKAPDKFVSKPGDQWQTAEATVIGNKITLTLNGVRVHDNVECTKPTGGELDNKMDQPGPIMLQGDHGNVSFRNISIKELK